ncbi:hypothetical protein ABIB83_001835 [Bradyrhizobium sp. I1.8.5]
MAFLERSGREEPDLSGGEKSYASEGLAGGALPIGDSATRREIGPANTEGQRPTHVGMSRDDGARGLPQSLISASASTSSPTAPRPPRPALTFVTCPGVSRSLQVGPAPAKQQQGLCEPRPGSANLRPASSAAFSAGGRRGRRQRRRLDQEIHRLTPTVSASIGRGALSSRLSLKGVLRARSRVLETAHLGSPSLGTAFS